MRIIQPTCREQLTAGDCDFIVSALAPHRGHALRLLLTDHHARDQILDDEMLFRALLERTGCLGVSCHLYFYVLVRRALHTAGIDDRLVADYVAALLAAFSRAQRLRRPPGTETPRMDYLVDMLAALEEMDDAGRFVMRAHVGNYTLFLAGIFPGHLHARTRRRAAPAMAYYEGVGSASFRVAAGHRLAGKYNLARPFQTLADAFRATRLALNDLAERLLELGPPADLPGHALG